MLSTWLNFGEILPQFFLAILSLDFKSLFLVEPSICHILRMVCPIDVKQKWNESTGCYADYGNIDLDLWPWPLTLNFQSQIVSREWEARLLWNEGRGFDSMPWCKTQPLCDPEAEDIVDGVT